MQKRLVTLALGVLSIPALGMAAYVVAHSVSDSPSPQVVLPASSQLSADGGNGPANANGVRRADDPAAHDGTSTSLGSQDNGEGSQPRAARDSTSTTLGHGNDGPGHDAQLGQGVAPPPGTTGGGAGHQIGDNRGGTATTTSTVVSRATSGGSTSGSGSSAGGQVGGRDDTPGHH
jgi:hypothetical protein